jgi:hypothetical protein
MENLPDPDRNLKIFVNHIEIYFQMFRDHLANSSSSIYTHLDLCSASLRSAIIASETGAQEVPEIRSSLGRRSQSRLTLVDTLVDQQRRSTLSRQVILSSHDALFLNWPMESANVVESLRVFHRRA